MATLKTQRTTVRVTDFLKSVNDPQRRKDAETVKKMMARITGHRARMWGDSIIGFGQYHYKYASGQEGDWPLTGLSPRKNALTIYIMPGFSKYGALLKKLGKHTHSKSCLYIKSLDDVDLKVLDTLITKSVAHMRKTYPTKA